jgi:endonuclease IV
MGKEIKIIKRNNQKRVEDYTFIDGNNIELRKLDNGNYDGNLSSYPLPSSSPNNKKYKEKNMFTLRNNRKKDRKSRDKSRLVGGHGTQSHSPVYE